MTIEQEPLASRIERLTGIKPDQEMLGKLHNIGLTDLHKYDSDDQVRAKVALIQPAQPDKTSELNGPGPKNDAFRTWLGKLADGFDKMQPVRRMMLHNEWKESLLAKPSNIDTLHAELSVRHNGNLEGANLTALEKLRIAHAVGDTIKPKPAEKVAMTPAIQALPNAQMRVEAIRAIQRVAVLKSSERDFDQREVAQLRARFGAIIPD